MYNRNPKNKAQGLSKVVIKKSGLVWYLRKSLNISLKNAEAIMIEIIEGKHSRGK